ncbi:MAG: hypothetical protein H6855_00045 [Rhodospirillales bacterium]|nr:hypothetical protein [Rhodospirillales bacterium]
MIKPMDEETNLPKEQPSFFDVWMKAESILNYPVKAFYFGIAGLIIALLTGYNFLICGIIGSCVGMTYAFLDNYVSHKYGDNLEAFLLIGFLLLGALCATILLFVT